MNREKKAGNIMSHLLSFHPFAAQQGPAPFILGKQAQRRSGTAVSKLRRLCWGDGDTPPLSVCTL